MRTVQRECFSTPQPTKRPQAWEETFFSDNEEAKRSLLENESDDDDYSDNLESWMKPPLCLEDLQKATEYAATLPINSRREFLHEYIGLFALQREVTLDDEVPNRLPVSCPVSPMFGRKHTDEKNVFGIAEQYLAAIGDEAAERELDRRVCDVLNETDLNEKVKVFKSLERLMTSTPGLEEFLCMLFEKIEGSRLSPDKLATITAEFICNLQDASDEESGLIPSIQFVENSAEEDVYLSTSTMGDDHIELSPKANLCSVESRSTGKKASVDSTAPVFNRSPIYE